MEGQQLHGVTATGENDELVLQAIAEMDTLFQSG